MGNQTRGIVDVAAGDGKTVRLQFTTNAMCELEEKTGKGILDLLADFEADAIAGRVQMKRVRLLVWGGMIEHQPDATPKDAGLLIDAMGGLQVAVDKLGRAIMAALPAADTTAEGESGNVKAA